MIFFILYSPNFGCLGGELEFFNSHAMLQQLSVTSALLN
jgi:hypothetical protein